jgi:tetratricopeptide (TPR) repeat protein
LLSVSTSIVPLSAHAQRTSPTAQTPANGNGQANVEADALVQQGVAQRRAGQDQLALESFRRAYALQPSPRIRAQIALAEQALGQWTDADRDLRAALAATNDAWIQRNRAALEAALNAISSRIATIELTCNITGARLFVNGREEGAFPLTQPVRVEAGTVALEVRMNGFRTARRTIDVEGGHTYRESFTLVPIPAEDPSQEAHHLSPHEPPAPPLSWALIGAGGAMLALGAIGHVYWQNRVALYNSDVTIRADGTFTEGCFYSTPEYPSRADRCGAIRSESWAGFGLALSGYVLGAAGVTAGLIVRFTNRPATTERSTTASLPASSPTSTVAATPRSHAARMPVWTCTAALGLSGAQCIVRF